MSCHPSTKCRSLTIRCQIDAIFATWPPIPASCHTFPVTWRRVERMCPANVHATSVRRAIMNSTFGLRFSPCLSGVEGPNSPLLLSIGAVAVGAASPKRTLVLSAHHLFIFFSTQKDYAAPERAFALANVRFC